jgi:hypothetical protein
MPSRLRFPGILLLAVFVLVLPIAPVTVSAQGGRPTPLLIKPVDNAVMDNGCQDRTNGVTWDFEWSSVGSVTTYQIKVWRNAAQPVINDMNVHGTTFHYDSPHSFIINSNLTGWHWMVRAKIGRNWALWSRQGNFTVQKLDTDCH